MRYYDATNVLLALFCGFCVGIAFGLAWGVEKATSEQQQSISVQTQDAHGILKPMPSVTPQ